MAVWQVFFKSEACQTASIVSRRLPHLTQQVQFFLKSVPHCHYYLQWAVTPDWMGSIALCEPIMAIFQWQRNPLLTWCIFLWIWKVLPAPCEGEGGGWDLLGQLSEPSTSLFYQVSSLSLSFSLILLKTIGDGGNWKLASQQEAIYEFSTIVASIRFSWGLEEDKNLTLSHMAYEVLFTIWQGGQLVIPLRMTLAKVKTILGADYTLAMLCSIMYAPCCQTLICSN